MCIKIHCVKIVTALKSVYHYGRVQQTQEWKTDSARACFAAAVPFDPFFFSASDCFRILYFKKYVAVLTIVTDLKYPQSVMRPELHVIV